MTEHPSCWRLIEIPHPFEPRIRDVVCGYDDRLVSTRCIGCIRAREESPRQQLDAIHALGSAAQTQAVPASSRHRTTAEVISRLEAEGDIEAAERLRRVHEGYKFWIRQTRYRYAGLMDAITKLRASK